MLLGQWRLLLAIQDSRAGVGVARLVEQTELARATVYRYLKLLENAGVPLHSVTVNGEKRYRFLRPSELPALGFTALQIAALHMARLELQPLNGAAVVRELDALGCTCAELTLLWSSTSSPSRVPRTSRRWPAAARCAW